MGEKVVTKKAWEGERTVMKQSSFGESGYANDKAVETVAVDVVNVRELGVDHVGSVGDEGFDLVGV